MAEEAKTRPREDDSALTRQILVTWSRFNFRTDRVHEIIREMQLTDSQIHRSHGFNMKAMLYEILSTNNKLSDYTHLRKRYKTSLGLSRGRIVPSIDAAHSKEWEVLSAIALIGRLNKEKLVYDLRLTNDDFVRLRGLSGTYMLDRINGARCPLLSETEIKSFDEEYLELVVDWQEACAECDQLVYTDAMPNCEYPDCSKRLCSECFKSRRMCLSHNNA